MILFHIDYFNWFARHYIVAVISLNVMLNHNQQTNNLVRSTFIKFSLHSNYLDTVLNKFLTGPYFALFRTW